MGLSDYLYNVVDAIPGERGGYADALVTLLGGDSKRQRRNQNIQAAMALFGANPSQQEIQAFADNEFQPAMPEGAGAEYGPRLNQLQETMQRNAPLVEAAKLAMAGGDTPDMASVEKAYKLNLLRNMLGNQEGYQFTPEQQAALVTGTDISPYRATTGGAYNRYSGGFRMNPLGQSTVDLNRAHGGLYDTQGQAVRERTASAGNVDRARIQTYGQQARNYGAHADLTEQQRADMAMRQDLIDQFLRNPNVDPLMKVDAAQKKKLSQAPQRFKIAGPDGKTQWATGTIGADGKPIVTPMTGPGGAPMEVPPNADSAKSYEWQSVDQALAERFPNSSPQERIAFIKGSEMERSRIMRDWQEEAQMEAEYDQEGGKAPASAPASAPTARAAVGSRSGVKLSAQQRAQLIAQAEKAIASGKVDRAKVEAELRRRLGE